MQFNMPSRPLLAVCPNPAWQQIMRFGCVVPGAVNRAVSWQECGGGKGVNVARVWRHLRFPAGVAVFQGGNTGLKLINELETSGVRVIAVPIASQTRTCVTVISQENRQVTELIGPAEEVNDQELTELQAKLTAQLDDFQAVALSGTTPPGVNDEFYAQLAAAAKRRLLPVVLDAVQEVGKTLQVGVTLLKINQEELEKLTGCHDIRKAACRLQQQYPEMHALAITAGADPAWLFTNKQAWQLTMPQLPAPVVNAIGAGDCATAVLTAKLAEMEDLLELPSCFRDAMACASASCLTEIPSLFDKALAAQLAENMTLKLVK